MKLGYADDWVLAYQSNDFKELEDTLSEDAQKLKVYFDRWYLKMNTTKSVSAVFHLDNHKAQKKLKIKINGNILPADTNPKYLGVILDRTLTYRKHLATSAKKIATRNSIIRKLAGTSWGASQDVLRTSSIALCYSVGEYCAPVWNRSSHSKLIDSKLRDSMRTISGSLKPTPTQWLPVMSSIAPPHLRREEMSQKWHQVLKEDRNIPLKQVITGAPTTHRLKSRKPFYRSEIENYNLNEKWKEEWKNNIPRGGEIIKDPTSKLPGFETATRFEWTTANRLRSRTARTAHNLHRWGMAASSTCPGCGDERQDTDHLVLDCPGSRIPGGYDTVHSCGDTFKTWVKEKNLAV